MDVIQIPLKNYSFIGMLMKEQESVREEDKSKTLSKKIIIKASGESCTPDLLLSIPFIDPIWYGMMPLD